MGEVTPTFDLTETQALKLEAELIGAFGTIANGGTLTNAVSPSGQVSKVWWFHPDRLKRHKWLLIY